MSDQTCEVLQQEIKTLRKQAADERVARQKAEKQLEDKSRELYRKYKKLSRNAQLMEAVIVNAKDGVIVTDADLENGPHIIYVNEAFTRMSGYTKDEIIGKTPRILQGPGTKRTVLEELGKCLKQGKSFKGELQNYTKDGIAYWLDLSIVPVRDETGDITHFTAIERDITQRKASEKEMQIHREAAEVANRAKGDFLANMSHELRTPMNGIIGLSELLSEMSLSQEQEELALAINGSSRNLLILLNDILDLSKIEANELTLEDIPFNLKRVVHQTIDLLRNTASRKSIVLEANINPLVPERIIGDPARMQQIMNNLIANAIKFTDCGYVRLDISTERDHVGDPVIKLRVEDTGIGIPDDKQESVFQKFTQADVSTARKYGGTGLGLAITKDLVEMMGGQIYLESVEGKGTTFYTEIPVEIAKAENAPIVVDGAGLMNAAAFDTNAQIMVVDDHPVNLLFMSKVLKKLGFKNLDEVSTGKQAVELYNQKTYDMIFMDCQMPEMDGFETSAHIREIENFSNDTKIIAVTADAMKGARERCIDSGMNDYISKPVDVEKLKTILCEWVPAARTPPDNIDIYSDVTVSEQGAGQMIMDWDRLDLFTDGDQEEEKQLIDIFVTYAQESLDIMSAECHGGCNETWKKAAHKLKGSAANLGAQVLSDFCLEAETGFDKDTSEKSEMLAHIQSAYQDVESALKQRVQADA